uniref:Ig-like domain-containing protein n=1 Tax=Catagonus wagneri TaxID=51154 RepID=A0A8C3W335_9CETA
MAWIHLLPLTLLTLCPESWLQPVLTQPASVLGALGQMVSIQCSGVSDNMGKKYAHQVPVGGPVPVIFADGSQPAGIPPRFSGSRSNNSASLTISGLQPEDEAAYYCLTHDNSLSAHGASGLTEVGQKPTPAVLCSPASP